MAGVRLPRGCIACEDAEVAGGFGGRDQHYLAGNRTYNYKWQFQNIIFSTDSLVTVDGQIRAYLLSIFHFHFPPFLLASCRRW